MLACLRLSKDRVSTGAIVLLCLLGAALSQLQDVNRINYGAMFQHRGYYDNSGATWLHVINIPFSRAPPPLPTPELAEEKNSIDSLHSQFTKSWANILQTLKDSFPEASEIHQHNLLPSRHVSDMRNQQLLAKLTDEERNRLGNLTKLQDSGTTNVSMVSTQEVTTVKAGLLGMMNKIRVRLLKIVDLSLYDQATLAVEAMQELDFIVSILQSLLRGRLHPYILRRASLQETLHSISQRLATEKPGYRPAHSDVSYYYRSGQTASFWNKAAVLSVVVRVPLISNATRFHLYKVDTYPIAIRQDSTDVTRLVNVPEYLAVREDGSEYLEFSAEDVSLCSEVDNWWSCSFHPSATRTSRPSCLMSVFSEDVLAMRDTCTYSVVQDGLEANVQELAPSLMLLSKISSYILQCKRSLSTHSRCTQCLVRVPCLCNLLIDGFDIRQRLRNCPENLTRDEVATPLHTSNLGYLAMVLPASHPLLATLQARGSSLSVLDEEIPPAVMGTLRTYASGLGYAELHATRAIITAKDVGNPTFAERWSEAMAMKEHMYGMKVNMAVALFLVVLVSFICSILVIRYQRWRLHYRLIALELNDLGDRCFVRETN